MSRSQPVPVPEGWPPEESQSVSHGFSASDFGPPLGGSEGQRRRGDPVESGGKE